MVWLWSVRVIHSECAQNGDKPSILGDYVFLAGSASEEGRRNADPEIKTPPGIYIHTRRVVGPTAHACEICALHATPEIPVLCPGPRSGGLFNSSSFIHSVLGVGTTHKMSLYFGPKQFD